MAFGMTPSEINEFMKDIGQEGNQVLGEYLTTEKIVKPKPEDAHRFASAKGTSPELPPDDRSTSESDLDVKAECIDQEEKDFWRELRGDYFDLRDYIKCADVAAKRKFLEGKRNDQIVLLREHLLMQMAYNTQYRDLMVQEVNTLTEVLTDLREKAPPPKPRKVMPETTNFVPGLQQV